ncbi:hypothetical protein ACR31U_35040 (plasmid) [Streptomyces rochei]|uniref:hypothetical protein n=1 Tax=Streptomyces rochei TaxID=1928 RepID=UPI00402A79A1
MSTSTAWHWAQRGAELWKEQGDPEGLAAALAALPSLDDLQGPHSRSTAPTASSTDPAARGP